MLEGYAKRRHEVGHSFAVVNISLKSQIDTVCGVNITTQISECSNSELCVFDAIRDYVLSIAEQYTYKHNKSEQIIIQKSFKT